jgi:hypothetical protein
VGKSLPQQVRSVLRAWLMPLSKPQQLQALVYLVGLLWIIRFRSLRECAQHFGQGRFDRLQHFLSQGVASARPLQHQWQRWLARLAPSGAPLLVLDDTACRRHGPAIEGTGLHHTAQGLVRGVCAVTAMLKLGARRFVWAVRGYRPRKACPREQFRSKIALAQEILVEAREFFPHGVLTVLMDSWYACAPLLNTIEAAGWTYVAALRSNRIVCLQGRKLSVRHLAKSRRRARTVRVGRRRFAVSRHEVWLPKVGMVAVFISRCGREARGFVTNALALSESQLVRLYLERFWIETLHQELKQHLGFGELLVRRWAAMERHWTLVGLGYNLVVLWNGKRQRSFRQMVRAFRASVCPTTLIQWHECLVKAA